MRLMILCLLLTCTLTGRAAAQDTLGLAAPEAVIESGLLKHILPRFSLKTGVRVQPDSTGPMRLEAGGAGTAVFQRGDTVYTLQIDDDPRQTRFRDWLLSEIGLRTVESFEPAEGVPFTAPAPVEVTAAPLTFDGDPVMGADLSLTLCGRCHVIGPQNALNGIDSTPSFPVLRAMSDWDVRFQQFFVLRPHAAFTQIDGVTPPFDPERPSPIVPVQLTLDDLDAILAFVAGIKAADLGAPLHLQ